MESRYSKILNREKKQAEMLLFGVIGEKVDGDYFAQELHWLSSDYDEILIRINSQGGDLNQGLSIISEIQSSPAFIITQITGIAASMAGVIALSGDDVRMNDYARLMLHSPYFVDDDGKMIENLGSKDRKSLKQMKGILIDLLSSRGKEKEEIDKILTQETWYDATGAKQEGFVDSVIQTQRKDLAAMEPLKLVAQVSNEQITNFNNEKSMKKIAAKFGLGEDATEDQILEKIRESETKAADQAVEKLLVVGKALGTITDENQEKVKRLAKADYELASEMYLVVKNGDDTPGEGGNADGEKEKKTGDKTTLIAELLKEVKGEGKKPEEKKLEDLSADEIDELREKDIKAYAALFKKRYGYEPEVED